MGGDGRKPVPVKVTTSGTRSVVAGDVPRGRSRDQAAVGANRTVPVTDCHREAMTVPSVDPRVAVNTPGRRLGPRDRERRTAVVADGEAPSTWCHRPRRCRRGSSSQLNVMCGAVVAVPETGISTSPPVVASAISSVNTPWRVGAKVTFTVTSRRDRGSSRPREAVDRERRRRQVSRSLTVSGEAPGVAQRRRSRDGSPPMMAPPRLTASGVRHELGAAGQTGPTQTECPRARRSCSRTSWPT